MTHEKIYTLKLDGADMALIVGALAFMGVSVKERNGPIRATHTEVMEQANAQGFDVKEELRRQKLLERKRKERRAAQ